MINSLTIPSWFCHNVIGTDTNEKMPFILNDANGRKLNPNNDISISGNGMPYMLCREHTSNRGIAKRFEQKNRLLRL